MKKILVGVDASHASHAALGWAGRLGDALRADVVAATVFSPEGSEIDPARYQALEAEVEQRLRTRWSTPDGATAPYRSLLLAGSADGLLDAADREDADLIVLGSEGHSRFANLHIGSLAHHLAHYTKRPLAIVPEAAADRGFARMVVGLDGSQDSDDAAHWCAGVAAGIDAHVVAVYALKPLIEWVPESDPHSWAQASERELDRWAGPLRDAGVSFETRLVKIPHPVDALARTVTATDADLVVVGARGIGGFLGLRVGRVPLQLVHHTDVPVVMVPANREGPGAASTDP